MADIDKALATQLKNIETRTGKTVKELVDVVKKSGLEKHGQIVKMLKEELGMGHGDANLIAHQSKQVNSPEPTANQDPQGDIYIGKKEALRPIHEALLKRMESLGEYETAPKKAYISYRRKKQFCMIGPATNTQIEVGLNIKELPEHERLKALGSGKMCNFSTRISDINEVDDELVSWITAAYQAAG